MRRVCLCLVTICWLFGQKSIAGERSSGRITFTTESINGGGISFSSSGTTSFGATLGQSSATKPTTSADKSLAAGFWSQIPPVHPAPTLFSFK